MSDAPPPRGHLACWNVRLPSHRTSMRLEPAVSEAVLEIAAREGITPDALVSRIDQAHRAPRQSLTSAVRTYCLGYWRSRAMELESAQSG